MSRECPTGAGGGGGDGGAMAKDVTGKCFSPAYKCHNCERKIINHLKEKNVKHLNLGKTDKTDRKAKTAEKKEDFKEKDGYKDGKLKTEDNLAYKRCTGCWLMTYCDNNCQKEHWQMVHRYHCPYLSGKKRVQVHKADSCKMCIGDEKNVKNLPKIVCTIEAESKRMSKELGAMFGFHANGKVCNCSLEYPSQHPFPLGEIPGKQVCIGLDEMIVHSERVTTAMINETIRDKKSVKKDIDQMFVMLRNIRYFRLILWKEIIVHGTWTCSKGPSDIMRENIISLLDDPRVSFRDNVWWKILQFSIRLTYSVMKVQFTTFVDSKCLDDPKFTNFKSVNSERASQFRNVVFVTENNLWSRFKLWPTLVGQRLMVLLPDRIRCLTCKTDLAGQVFEMSLPNDAMKKLSSNANWPNLIPEVAEDGGFIVFCPFTLNGRCIMTWFRDQNQDHYADYKKEMELFVQDARHCCLCLKLSLSSHRCSDCLAAQYCSTECQKKDLHFHRTVCSTWANDQNKKLASSRKQKKILKMSKI